MQSDLKQKMILIIHLTVGLIEIRLSFTDVISFLSFSFLFCFCFFVRFSLYSPIFLLSSSFYLLYSLLRVLFFRFFCCFRLFHCQLQRPPPTAPEAIEALNRVTVSEEFIGTLDSRDCSICQCEFEPDERILEMPCKHVYHHDCLLPWLQQTSTCPECRLQLPTSNRKFERRRAAFERK